MSEKIETIVTTTLCLVILYVTFFGAGFEAIDTLIVALLHWLLKK